MYQAFRDRARCRIACCRGSQPHLRIVTSTPLALTGTCGAGGRRRACPASPATPAAMPSADPSQTPERRTRAQAPTASILQLSPRVRFQAVSERQRRGIPQPSPSGWVTGPPMQEPCKGGITARINPKHSVRHTSPDTVRGMCGIRLETTTVDDVPPGCRYSAPPHPHQIG
jgi:hypothetical protein